MTAKEQTFYDILDEQFPKGKSKERGHALVLFAFFMIKVKKLKDEIKKEIKIQKHFGKEQKQHKRSIGWRIIGLKVILSKIDSIFGGGR